MKQLYLGLGLTLLILVSGIFFGNRLEDTHHPQARDLERAALCAGDETILSRFIIQLYDFESKAAIVEAYPFPDDQFLFTAYKFGTENPAQIMKLCYQENVPVITVEYGKWNAETIQKFAEKGFVIFEHTVNRPDEAREALARGIRGLYTDFLSPADLA